METELLPLLRNVILGIAGVGLIAWFASDEERAIRSTRITGPVALLLGIVWLGMVAFYAPLEKVQGVVQKIVYVHAPCAPAAYLGFILTAVGGVGYLRTHKQSWDRFALCSAEVGVLFCTLILLSGPIWAKPIWATGGLGSPADLDPGALVRVRGLPVPPGSGLRQRQRSHVCLGLRNRRDGRDSIRLLRGRHRAGQHLAPRESSAQPAPNRDGLDDRCGHV